MGAATWRSRIVRWSWSPQGEPTCFNGAATWRSRIAEPVPAHSPQRPASMGPRPGGRG